MKILYKFNQNLYTDNDHRLSLVALFSMNEQIIYSYMSAYDARVGKEEHGWLKHVMQTL